MVGLARALMVGWIEEQIDVALMGPSMVDHGCCRDPAHGLASLT